MEAQNNQTQQDIQAKKEKQRKELAKRAYAKNNLKGFLLYKWEYYNQSVFLDNWHYDYLCRILESTLPSFATKHNQELIKRLMINMPPSYGKTELIARTFIAWALGHNPKRKFFYISYSDELCRKINNQVRDLIKSSTWQSVFNKKATFLQDNANEFILREGGGLFVTTLKSALTGFHADQILIDDPIKVSDMSSRVERERTNTNFKESVLSRLQNNQSNITILMQRLGENDLCGFLLNPKHFEAQVINQWRQISLKALNKEKETYKISDFSYTREAEEALFKSRHNKDELLYLKQQMGEDEFSTQYQQEPIASEAGFFEEVNYKLIPSYELGMHNEYIMIDNATSLNTKADNRAIICVGIENYKESERYVLKDCLFGIWDEEAMISNIIEMMSLYPKARVFIESDGGGIVLERLLQKKLVSVNTELKKQDKPLLTNYISTYPANRKISKVEKIKAMKPFYNTGHLVFLNNARGLNQIKKELLSFNPEKPFRKDDCIDALASSFILNECIAPSKYIKESDLSNKRHKTYKAYPTVWRV